MGFARTVLSNKHCFARLFACTIFMCFFLKKISEKAQNYITGFILSLRLQFTDTDLSEINGNYISVKKVYRISKPHKNNLYV